MADDPLEQLSHEEKQALAALVQEDSTLDISRRDALALMGGASLGAIVGGAGYNAVGSAKADASTSDNDGNVGMPNNRIDVFADGVDVGTELTGPNGNAVPVGADLELAGNAVTFDRSAHYLAKDSDNRDMELSGERNVKVETNPNNAHGSGAFIVNQNGTENFRAENGAASAPTLDGDVVTAPQIQSASIPVMVSIYLDDSTGEAVAVVKDKEHSRSTDHATVLQDACDYVHGRADMTGGDDDWWPRPARLPQGWVDCNLETLDITSQVTVKSQVGLRNLKVDANNSVGRPIFVEDIDTNSVVGVAFKNVEIKNASGHGLVIVDGAHCNFEDVSVHSCSGQGFKLVGCISVNLYDCFSVENDGIAYYISDTSSTHGNNNKLYDCIAEADSDANVPAAVKIEKTVDTTTYTTQNRIVNMEITGSYDRGVWAGDATELTYIVGLHDDSATTNGAVYVHGPNANAQNTWVKDCRGSVELDGADNTLLIWNKHPEAISSTSSTSHTEIWASRPDPNELNLNGTREKINGIGYTSSDPTSSGDWNGAARHGDMVSDGTNLWTYIEWPGGPSGWIQN